MKRDKKAAFEIGNHTVLERVMLVDLFLIDLSRTSRETWNVERGTSYSSPASCAPCLSAKSIVREAIKSTPFSATGVV